MTDAEPSVQCHYFAGQPVVVIDNAHPDPTSLAALGKVASFARDPGNYYPGLRAPADKRYKDFLQACIHHHAISYLSEENTGVEIQACLYSLACTPEAQLRPIQCVPHIDSPEPSQLAAVHYLCGEPFGGTSFYRHKSTGLAAIDRGTMANFFAQVKQQMMAAGKSALHYTNGSNEWFEQVGQVPAVFNRLIVYPGNCLHAGDLQPEALIADPERGRLTVNSFLQLVN